MSEPHDISSLVRRLRDAAATLDADQPPIAPPIGDWHRCLAELRERPEPPAPDYDLDREALEECLASASLEIATSESDGVDFPEAGDRQVEWDFALLDPQCPSLVELSACDRDTKTFVEGMYRHLLGRPSDREGRDNYLTQLTRRPRLSVLAEISQSDEARQYCQKAGIVLPMMLQRIQGWQSQMRRRGTLADWLLDRFLGGVMRRYRRRWARNAHLSRLEARVCLQASWSRHDRDVFSSTSKSLASQARHDRDVFSSALGALVSRAHHDRELFSATLKTMDASLSWLVSHEPTWHQERRHLSAAILEMDDRQQYFSQRQDHEYARQRSLWSQHAELRRALASRQAEPSTQREPPVHQPQASTPKELDAYYLAFEDAFRGPEADIAAHLDQYRDDWTRARQAGERALDLGCGRGEWLRLLDRAGFTPRGVDLNTTMVDHCRERGFDVAHQDAIAALEACESDSLALISGFHIAEHLPFDALFRLVGEASRALAPGGMLILETPNPENLIVASYSFYHDLTHRNPLTPPTLQFLFTFHGFAEADIKRFNPPPEHTRVPGDSPVVERLNHMLVAPMDYAVVGVKPRDAAAWEGLA